MLSTVRRRRALFLSSASTAVLSSLRRPKFYSDGPSISEASSTAPPPSPAPPSPTCLIWIPKWTSTSLSLSPKNSKAVQQLSSGEAPGSDAIPAEVYKHGGPQLMDHLTAPFQEMWRQGEVPQDFTDATIVHLHKQKGNRQLCDNHRGISLLNIAWKIFARICLNRLTNHLEEGLLSDCQCSFRRHRGTKYMICIHEVLKQIQSRWGSLVWKSSSADYFWCLEGSIVASTFIF
nr:unnamed protein product [Spirometra erinaceieuropaei]